MGAVYPAEPELGVKLPTPRVTVLLIAINVVAYAVTSIDTGLVQVSPFWLYWGAFIPAYMSDLSQAYRLLTSMFMHGNLFHLLFNMLYLYFFGKPVESVLGGKRYLALYLASGLIAEVYHAAMIPVEGYAAAVTPALGASGAISGVLGAYLLLFPGSKLTMCFFYFYFPVCMTLSAAAYLIFWFASQVLQGYLGANLGVAVFAHAGGFLAGLALLPYVIDRDRHRLFRMLTASTRALKHVYFGRAGLSPFAKFVLAALILAVIAGGVYSAVASEGLAVPIKVLNFRVSYKLYCQPGRVLCDAGTEEEPVVIKVEEGIKLASPIASGGVRVVYNRLEAIGVLYNKAYSGTSITVRESKVGKVLGVRVKVNVTMDAKYDEMGALEEARGEMITDVLFCERGRCIVSGVGEYKFSIESLYGAERGQAELPAVITTLSIASVAVAALALSNVMTKTEEIEIVA